MCDVMCDCACGGRGGGSQSSRYVIKEAEPERRPLAFRWIEEVDDGS